MTTEAPQPDGPNDSGAGSALRSKDVDESAAGPVRIWRRVMITLVPLALLIVAVRLSGVAANLDVAAIRNTLAEHGVWALPVFVFVYGLGIVAYVPGSVFVGAAVLAYGPIVGGLVSYFGSLWGNVLSFGWVRVLGYRPLAQLDWPILSSLLRGLDTHPTTAVMLVRVVFPTTAPVNHVLALSAISWRSFVIGSLIGVLPQLIATVLLFSAAFG